MSRDDEAEIRQAWLTEENDALKAENEALKAEKEALKADSELAVSLPSRSSTA